MTTRELDPVIDCTRMQLCFAAWQRAQCRSDLTPSSAAWDAFVGWWDDRDLLYFANLRQLTRAAWNASSGESESELTTDADRALFDAWWSSVVDKTRRGSVQVRSQLA